MSTLLPRLALLLVLVGLAGPAPAQPAARRAEFVMATHQPPDSFQGQWVRRIYTEAFRRLDIPVEIGQYPLQRMTEMVDRGELDGDVGRVLDHAAAHPQQVRVEEPMYEIEMGLFALDDSITIGRAEDLGVRPWRVVFVRGIALCERLARPHVAPDNLTTVTTNEQGMQMLALRRADMFCTANHTIADLTARERFRGLAPRMVLSSGRLPLYPYLARQHESLAPRLAAALREMRRDGTIERLRLESLAAASR